MANFFAPPIAGSLVSFLYNGGALWAFLEVLRGRKSLSTEPRFRATVMAIYAYCLALIIAAAINPHRWESAVSLLGLVSLLLFPFAYSTWRIARKNEIVEACLTASAAASIGGLILAMIQVHLLLQERASGGAGNALVFASVIALAGGVSLIGVFHYRDWRRLLMLGAFLSSALAVVYSGSRAPLMICFANTVIVAAIYGRGKRHIVAALAALLLLAAVVLLFAESGLTGYKSRLELVPDELRDALKDGDFTTSIGQRLALLQAGVGIWLDKPIFGHGAGSIRTLIQQTTAENYGISLGYTHFHNVFINTLVEGGILALFGLIMMIVIPVHTAFSVLRHSVAEAPRFGATLLLVFFSMFVITGTSNIVLHHDIMDAVFMCFLAVGLFLAVERDDLVSGE
jgi:O-antigen ligase